MEGGFNPDQQNYRYDEELKVVLFPENKIYELSDPDLPESIRLSVEGVITTESAFRKDELQSCLWDGEQRQVTKFADLQQLDNGVKVPPKGWVCSKCDKRDNLWMNLTDGTILCGRKNYDGSGGNNHAVEYYEATKYPLAVKLGTITPQGADVYSYPEDNMVEDPKLTEHLAHFGINVNQMEKTDKTMIELEIDANKRFDEWLTIQEANSNLKLLYGPGFVGMENLGNSCYLNSVMQVLFSTPEFKETYFPVSQIYTRSSNPFEDFDFQMAKLAYGLLSPYYSVKPADDQPVEQKGIRPTSFKQLVGKNHPEFSTKKQQDAEEFFRHIMDLIEKSYKRNNKVLPNLSDVFKFKIEDKTQCLASGNVDYAERNEYVLSLPIALDKASNMPEVQVYLEEKEKADAEKRTAPEVVRPRVKLLDCLAQFAGDEIIDDFLSPQTKTKGQAKRQYRLKTYPDYLMLHMQKFTIDSNWQAKKIDCSLDVPEQLDLAYLRGKGPQPGEELLPESSQAAAEPAVSFDEAVLSQLVEMGFTLDACKRALLRTKSENVEVALNWLFEHNADADFNAPIENELRAMAGKKPKFIADQGGVRMITSMGIPEAHAIRGLNETRNNVEAAINWIFANSEELSKPEVAEIGESDEDENAGFRDGNEKYQLVAFISHMGSSAQCGHYVCHILKDGKWVIHNDSKVAQSEHPPTDLAYMYLYKRSA